MNIQITREFKFDFSKKKKLKGIDALSVSLHYTQNKLYNDTEKSQTLIWPHKKKKR